MCCFDLRFNNLLKVTITNVFVIIRFSVRGVLVTNTGHSHTIMVSVWRILALSTMCPST